MKKRAPSNITTGYPISRLKKIILTAILLALLIVLSRFLSVRTPIMKISFGFLPTMLCATWLGWKWTLLLNVLADPIGATLFPSGAFFIGYTITTAVAALIYGFLLYRPTPDKPSYRQYVLRVAIALVLVALIANLALNTLWTSITSGQAFWPLLVGRIYKNLITAPVHFVIFLAVEALLRKPLSRILYSAPADPIEEHNSKLPDYD